MSALNLSAKLDRTDSSTPWGFRMYGGVDFGVPLNIQKVNPGSLAARCGLQVGDIITKIGGSPTDRMRHKEAQEQILLAGNSLELSLQRGGPGSLPVKHVEGPAEHQSSAFTPIQQPVAAPSQKYGSGTKPFGSANNDGYNNDYNLANQTAQLNIRPQPNAQQGNAEDSSGSDVKHVELTTNTQPDVLPTLPTIKPDVVPSHPTFAKPKPAAKPMHDVKAPAPHAVVSKELIDETHLAKVSDMYLEEDRPAVQSKSFRALQEMLDKGEVTGLKQYQQRKTTTPAELSSEKKEPIVTVIADQSVQADAPHPPVTEPPQQITPSTRSEVEEVHEGERKKITIPSRFNRSTHQASTPATQSFTSARQANETETITAVPLTKFNTSEPKSASEAPVSKAPEPSSTVLKTTFGVTPRPFGASTERRLSRDFITSGSVALGTSDKVDKGESAESTKLPHEEVASSSNRANDEMREDSGRKKITISGRKKIQPSVVPESPGDKEYKPPENIVLVTEKPINREGEFSVVGVEFHFKDNNEPSRTFQHIHEEPEPSVPSYAQPTKTSSTTWQPQMPTGPRNPKFAKRGEARSMTAGAGRIPVCSNCGVTIRGPFVMALDKTWCPDHFVCGNPNCRRSLIDVGFVEEQGQLFCEKDYEMYFAPHCGRCNSPIIGDMIGALGTKYHPHCFLCTHCRQPIGEGTFHLQNGEPYCERDWAAMFQTKCHGCQFPIEPGDRWVEALSQNWHSECFNCSTCQANLEGQSFYAKGGRPYCKKHAAGGRV